MTPSNESNGSDGRADIPRFDDERPAEQPAELPDLGADGPDDGPGPGSVPLPGDTDGPPGAPPEDDDIGRSLLFGSFEPYPDRAWVAHHMVDPARALAARLLLMVPLVIGTVLAEAIFAARGPDGSDIAMVAAVIAFLLCWQGVAWALRSWVAVLLTFVPAVMITLGAAMVGAVEPVGGAILLVLGGTLLLAVVWFRVAAPSRRWTPGWSAGGDALLDIGALEGHADGSGAAKGRGHGTGEPSGAAPVSGPPGRPVPRWDTSATDVAARDALVLALCQRGGAAGPTVATLEEFFTGNGDPRSIAVSLRGAVPLSTFATVLHTLRARPDVSEVLVQVEPLGEGDYAAGCWPAAGSVRVVGAVAPDDLDAAVAALKAAPALGPLPITELADGRPAPAGAGEYAVWWG